MEKETNINKIVRQHLEMDNFFTGGFTVKGQKAMQEQVRAEKEVSNAKLELEKIADVIVAMGAPAAKTLLDANKPIGQLREQFHEYYAGIGRPPIKLMATYHPAYLLRSYSPDNRKRVWDDMKQVLAELKLPVP